jgi:uncharacterized protein (TIGR02421 family)
MEKTSPEPWITEIDECLRRGEAVRRELPGGGVLNIERPLPYLFVHRALPASTDDVTPRLLRGEASYLLWRGGPEEDGELHRLLYGLASAGAAVFGAILILELWAAREGSAAVGNTTFRILCPANEATGTVAALERQLSEMRELHEELRVVVEPTVERQPPGLAPLFSVSELYELECLLLGLEVPAVYLQPGRAGEPARSYPVFFRHFRERLARALRRVVYDFLRVQTDAHIGNYRMLGRRTVDDAVWHADRALAELGASFDFLLLVSPINGHEAWRSFRDASYQRAPEFRHRLLPVDPDLLKRRLWEIDLEPVDDPSLLYLLADKRDELDKQVSMLIERRTRNFLYGSIRLYGPVDDALLETAEGLLAEFPPGSRRARVGAGARVGGGRRSRAGASAGDSVDAAAVRRRALEEFAYYRALDPGFAPDAQIRPDVAGLQVSRGNLLIDERISLDPERVEALVQHEVGTHIVTYFNGAAQPLRQLAAGLAEYDEFQEGLGILAEYLVDGLTPTRMRVLAARVVAARAVEGGAEFVETFRLLVDDYGFTAGSAFDIATRAHEGGGHTRDVIYLRGFIGLQKYLAEGGELEPLYIGKIARKHVPVILELRDRGILHEPALRPRFLDRPEVRARLEALRSGLPLTQVVRGAAA